MTVFSAILLFVLGLAAWAATERHYEQNLVPAASIEGRVIPKRELQRELRFQLVRFFHEFGVPPEFEKDPRLARDKSRYEDAALEAVVEHGILDRAARATGLAITSAEVDEQYGIGFGQVKVRHILIEIPKGAEDKELADLNAAAKARAIANDLKQSPGDQDLWNRLAAEHSADPGSKFSGGELGFASSGQYVREFEDAIRVLAIGQVSDPVKTEFGYHVLQVQERRPPEQNELVQRYLAGGFSVDDLRAHARSALLRKEFTKRAQAEATTGPTEQVRIAKIVVNTPLPTASSFQQFGEALQKLSDVRQELEKGTDFAEVATKLSDDLDTKEKGGEVGWIARGMLTDLKAEDAIFSRAAGERTQQITGRTQSAVYRVLERDPARELAAEQKETIKTQAYRYWLEKQKRAYDVHKLVVGLSVE